MRGQRPLVDIPLTRRLDGGIELEYYLPIRTGDVISCTARLADLYEKETKLGKMLFEVSEVIYKNQAGEVVGKQQGTLIMY